MRLSGNAFNGDCIFNDVQYKNFRPQTMAFGSLARLPISRIRDDWMSYNAEVSSSYKDFIENIDSWRKLYHENFIKSITTKSRDWDYESESRLVIDDMFVGINSKQDQKLTYGIQDLKGVIFGIKTSDSDKVKILEILSSKNLSIDFTLYQAVYSHDSSSIHKQELNLLKQKQQI